MGRKPKAKTYDWTEEKEEMLISWWEANEFLYNLKCKAYKDQAKKTQAYEEIAAKIGTTADVITDRMTTLRTMLGAVRRKERDAKSGSAAYHPSHRDRIIKAKMGFLEKHVRTRKTVSTLPKLPQSQVPQSQVSNSDLFSEDGSVSREVMQKYLTPGALDDFMGIGMDVDENSNNALGGEEVGLFPIPNELLVNMPIADVTPTTRIIHLGAPTQTNLPAHASQSQEPAAAFHRPPTPQPGTSGVPTGEAQHELMDIESAATPMTTVAAETSKTPSTTAATFPKQPIRNQLQGANKTRVQPQVKKGVQTKNKKTQPQDDGNRDERDETLHDRMALLAEMTRLMKDCYGSRRSEVEVWAQYIGLKASRIREGRRRDRAFMHVEDIINEAVYEDTLDY